MVKAVCPSLRGSDFLKVPKEYKSSDRFNAGVDVIYDDDSKLQYAPFIYAGVTAGDNGGDGGEEEGEDVMVVHINADGNDKVLDKNWGEIKGAIDSGKFVYLVSLESDVETIVYYIDDVYSEADGTCYLNTCRVFDNTIVQFVASSDTAELRYSDSE